MSHVPAYQASPASRVDVCLDPASGNGRPNTRVALVDGDLRLTYSEARRLVDRYAEGLVAAGVRPGDRVMLLGHSCLRATAVFLATASIGGAYVGLNPKYTATELGHILLDADPALVISLIPGEERSKLTQALAEVQASSRRTVRILDLLTPTGSTEVERLLSETPPDTPDLLTVRTSVHDELPAVVLYTSGSTGAPKGVLLSHRSLLLGVSVMSDLVPEHPRCLTDYPINHISWVLETCLLTLCLRGTLFHRQRFDPAATLALIEREEVTVWQGAPSMFSLCMSEPTFSTRDLTSVASVLYFGGSMAAAKIRQLQNATGAARVATGWGMTETAGGVTLTDPDASVETLATTVGRPHPTVDLILVDDEGRPVSDNEEGEILVRAPMLFQGYRNQPVATARAVDANGFLHTGDLAVRLDDGNLRLVGRRGDMFKSGGYNVHPHEVELVLEQHRAVALAAVISVPDDLWGEVGVAYIVPERSREPPTAAEMKEHCAVQLANYKIPKAFHVRASLPLLGNGKVHKRALTAALQEQP